MQFDMYLYLVWNISINPIQSIHALMMDVERSQLRCVSDKVGGKMLMGSMNLNIHYRN